MRRKRFDSLVFVLISLMLPAAGGLRANSIPKPADHLGFEPGAEGQMAPWPAILGYFEKLAAASDRVSVRILGKTTLGRQFPLAVISAPENLGRLPRLAEISRTLADPRGLSQAEIDRLVSEGRAVVAVTAGLHASEVAATQMSPSLAYRLATASDKETLRILEQTVFLLFPCFNPDGEQMLAEWVEKTRGTKYQGGYFPDLYHHYAGHDNNRDAYMLNLNESRMFAKVVYREWIPQLYLDIHQMGSYGARLYVPPYHDPINPNVDPMVWMEHELVGAHMQIALEREGLRGVLAGAPYTGWWFPSFHMVTNHHNIAGMLTETASARTVWPIYIHPHQLQPQGRSHSERDPMQLLPHPWPGGWWGMQDMVRQQAISTYAMLGAAARNRETLLRNMVLKASRTIDRAGQDAPEAFVIRAAQHDPLTVEKLVGKLMLQGVEVHRAGESFIVGGQAFSDGDYVVSLAQPNGALARSLLAEARYPDNAITRRADGRVFRPYDMANFVLAEHMGVETVELHEKVPVSLRKLDEAPRSEGGVDGGGSAGWLLSHAFNDGFKATNRLLAGGADVYWMKEPVEVAGGKLAPGALWIPAGAASRGQIEKAGSELGLRFIAAATAPSGKALKLRPVRIGMYRRFLGGNKDEGWTRLIFDRWEFPYQRVTVDDIKQGALENIDVFLIPEDSTKYLKGIEALSDDDKQGEPEYPEIFMPPEYRKGFDDEATKKLKEFVRGGGGLVLLGNAAEFGRTALNLPVENVVDGLPESQYFCPGSTLRARFDAGHPIAYGMPETGLILNWATPTFRVRPTPLSERVAVPVIYEKKNLLKSGWLVGERHLSEKAAVVDLEYGDGRVILIGFRVQHRAQTHGTFKVFFNALYYPPAEEVLLGE